MIKHLIAVFLLIFFLILPSTALDTPCPICTTCPPQVPYIVYVTVTVPVPIQVTQQITQSSTIPIKTSIPTTMIEGNILGLSFEKYMEIIFGGILLVLIIGIILMLIQKGKINKPLNTPKTPIMKKQFKLPKFPKLFKKKPQENKKEELDLFEEDDTKEELDLFEDDKKEEVETIKIQPKKPKKKKPKSLLDQDFEF